MLVLVCGGPPLAIADILLGLDRRVYTAQLGYLFRRMQRDQLEVQMVMEVQNVTGAMDSPPMPTDTLATNTPLSGTVTAFQPTQQVVLTAIPFTPILSKQPVCKYAPTTVEVKTTLKAKLVLI